MLNNRWVAYVEQNIIAVHILSDHGGFINSIIAAVAYVMGIDKVTLAHDCVSQFIRNHPMRPIEVVCSWSVPVKLQKWIPDLIRKKTHTKESEEKTKELMERQEEGSFAYCNAFDVEFETT